MNLLQHLGPLLQAKQHILLDQRKLNLRGQLLQLRQLRVRLGQKGFLVLLAAQRKQRAAAVVARQAFLGDFRFSRCEYRDLFLVLVEFVALSFKV